MKKIFFVIMCFTAPGAFAQPGANPVSVKTVKNCIDESALKDF